MHIETKMIFFFHLGMFLPYIIITAEGFEKCSQNEGWVGYLPLESNISIWSNIVSLKTKVNMLFFTHNQALPKFCTHERSWRRGYGGKMYAHGDFFFRFDPAFFLLFISLFPSLFFCFLLRISYAGPFETRLIGVNWAALRRYSRLPNIFGPKIWPVFLTFEVVRALPLHARELIFIPPTNEVCGGI